MKFVRFFSFLGAITIAAYGQSPTVGGCQVFPANNILNTPINTLPIAGTSATYVATIGATKSLHPDFGPEFDAGIPFITVTGSQTKYPATFQYADDSDAGPYAVPLNVPIEGGSAGSGDRHAIALDTTNCKLYELYNAYPQAASWQAGSGAIFDLNSNALRPEGSTSADAAGLSIFAGLVRYQEAISGEIRHAIRFTVPHTRQAYVWPARHYASTITDAAYPPMGARFRLRADFDISGYSPLNQTILRALKTYGMILADNGSSWFITGDNDSHWDNNDLHKLTQVKGADFEQVDVSPLMVDANSGQVAQAAPIVTLAPGTATVKTGFTQQFAAQVQNGGGQSITWQVNGIAGGSAVVGRVSSAGLYTAPATAPVGGMVAVQAVVGGTIATSVVTVQQTVVIMLSPANVSLLPGKLLLYYATTNVPLNGGLVWQVNGITGGNAAIGTISATGLYAAPTQVAATTVVRISVTSTADATVTATTQATIPLVGRR